MSPKVLLYLADAAVPAVGLCSYIFHFRKRAPLEEACLDMVNIGTPVYVALVAAMWFTW